MVTALSPNPSPNPSPKREGDQTNDARLPWER